MKLYLLPTIMIAAATFLSAANSQHEDSIRQMQVQSTLYSTEAQRDNRVIEKEGLPVSEANKDSIKQQFARGECEN